MKTAQFKFQTNRNSDVVLRQTYLVVKLKFVDGRGYGTYNNAELKKQHKEESKADDETTAAEEKQKLPLVTHLNNIL